MDGTVTRRSLSGKAEYPGRLCPTVILEFPGDMRKDIYFPQTLFLCPVFQVQVWKGSCMKNDEDKGSLMTNFILNLGELRDSLIAAKTFFLGVSGRESGEETRIQVH